jgi:hypothetical protein
MEVVMQGFTHDANIALYRKLIAESERDPSRDEDRHKMLLTLLGEEEAKDRRRPDSQTLATLFAETLIAAEFIKRGT